MIRRDYDCAWRANTLSSVRWLGGGLMTDV
jgi:hypothetical protein